MVTISSQPNPAPSLAGGEIIDFGKTVVRRGRVGGALQGVRLAGVTGMANGPV